MCSRKTTYNSKTKHYNYFLYEAYRTRTKGQFIVNNSLPVAMYLGPPSMRVELSSGNKNLRRKLRAKVSCTLEKENQKFI